MIAFCNKVVDDLIKNGSTVQTRLPSASGMVHVSGTAQQARVRGTIPGMLGCGLQQVEMAQAITELQYEAALSGYRQSQVSSARKHLISQPSYTKERKDNYDNVSVGAGEVGQWPVNFAMLGILS